jgi:hypothetical protein
MSRPSPSFGNTSAVCCPVRELENKNFGSFFFSVAILYLASWKTPFHFFPYTNNRVHVSNQHDLIKNISRLDLYGPIKNE